MHVGRDTDGHAEMPWSSRVIHVEYLHVFQDGHDRSIGVLTWIIISVIEASRRFAILLIPASGYFVDPLIFASGCFTNPLIWSSALLIPLIPYIVSVVWMD